MTTTADGKSREVADDRPDDDEGDDSLVEHAPTVPLGVIFRRFWPYTRDFRGRMVLSLPRSARPASICTRSSSTTC